MLIAAYSLIREDSMAWTVERLHGVASWPDEREAARDTQPLAHFIAAVDRLFYAALFAFALCVIALIAR